MISSPIIDYIFYRLFYVKEVSVNSCIRGLVAMASIDFSLGKIGYRIAELSLDSYINYLS